MKNIFICLLMAIALPALAQNDTLGYVVSIKKGKFLKKDGIKYYEVPVKLTNTSKDTLHYLSWSCSWQRFYSFDNSAIHHEGIACDKNMPTILSLPPNESNTVFLNLEIQNTSDKELKFRVGHNVVKLNLKTWAKDWDRLRKTKNIIWSNPITIKPK
jgi:hypothetical protein